MSPPEIWGPPIWTFFHTLAEKVNEEKFPKIKHELFFFIKRICNFLPCPECSQHAMHFLARLNLNNIKDKSDFIKIIYIFHNAVNKRKKKILFNYGDINKYKNHNIITTFNNFIRVYHTKGNMNLIVESFQRSLLVKDLKYWLINKLPYFKPSIINKQIQNLTKPLEYPISEETLAIETATVEEPILEEPIPFEKNVLEEQLPIEEPVLEEPVTIEEPVLEEPIPVEEPVLEESLAIEESK